MKTVKKGLAFRRIAGELFIVDAQRAELHELNGPAALIWEGLSSGKGEESIAAAIVDEFEVSEQQARADKAEFLKELAKAGLLAERTEK